MKFTRIPCLLLLALGLASAEDLLGDQPTPPATKPARAPAEEQTEARDDVGTRMAVSGARRLVDEGKMGVRRFNEDKARNATAIVDAAIAFAKARRLVDGSGNADLIADIQANLFWCRKQMDVDAMKDYLARKGEEGRFSLAQMDAVAALRPDPAEAATYLARAEAFARSSPTDHLQQAVRYLEVASRFPSTAEGTEANRRSLAAQEAMLKAAADAAAAARSTRFTAKAVPARGQAEIPGAAAQKDALAMLKKTYAKDFAKRDPKDKRRLARKLFEDAPANKADPAIVHAELSETMRLAGECEDYVRLLDAIDRLAGTFKGVDAMAEKQAALKRMSGKPVAAAILKLLDSPEDPAANTVAGRWFAFSARRWPEGLNMLIRSGEEAVAKVAQMELDKPANSTEQVQIGDAWYELGRKTTVKDERLAMLGRAQSWYQQALPSLGGLVKDRIATRMVEIDKQLPLDLDRIDWNNLTASQWDKLRGVALTVQAKLERTDAGTLKPGQRVRVVPHPTDTWTFSTAYNQQKIVCNWKGHDPRQRMNDNTVVYWSFMGIAGQPYGAVLTWLDNGEKKPVGTVTGPGRLWIGPSTDRSWESDTGGAIRVKILPADEDDD